MATKTKKKTQKKEIQHFNDLLLPIIFTLCVLPFTVRLKEYEYGYSKYAWHSPESVMQDLYTYYRMWFFLIIIAFALVILVFRMGLYKEKNKSAKIFIPFGVYLLFAMASCIFSINPKAAWLGDFVDLEGFFVLAGYGLIAFYTYQIMESERDFLSIYKGMQISFGIISVIGWLQIFGLDPLDFPFVQKLVMSEELYEYYEGEMYSIFSGNNVALSLYNPNFAVIYLIMFASVFATVAMFAEEKKDRLSALFFLIDALILTWFTYSRSGLVALAVVFILGAVMFIRKKGKNAKKYIFIAGGALIAGGVLFFAVDYLAFNSRYANRLFDEKKDNQLKSILTTENGVQINYGEESYILSEEEEEEKLVLKVLNQDGQVLSTLADVEDSYRLPIETNCEIGFFEWDGESSIFVQMYDNLLTFVNRDGAYIYKTAWGKEDSMEEIAHVDAHGYEYLGSGRVYIWTRILPILKKYIIVGSGPDTFAEAYPQNDYAGKLVYAETPARIMERAHNDYLMKWVQTGFISLLAVVCFYILSIKKGWKFYQQKTWSGTKKNLLGLGCLLGCIAYMICGLFSDSTLYTTPTFYVFLGIMLSAII